MIEETSVLRHATEGDAHLYKVLGKAAARRSGLVYPERLP